MSKAISASLEDYLEAILRLERRNRVARAGEIAGELGVARASVTSALKNLGERGLINYRPYAYVTLTEQGRRLALEVSRRHGILRDFFQNVLGMSGEAAEENACRVEHVLDAEAMARLESLAMVLELAPGGHPRWREAVTQALTGQAPDPAANPEE